MAEYIDRDEVLEYRETVTTDDYSGNETLDVVAVEEILEVEPADVVERSKIDKAITEISNIDWNEIIVEYDDVEIGFKDRVKKILIKNGVIE